MKMMKKPWNEGREAKHGTKSWREYGKYGAESLVANGSGSMRTNLTVMLLTKRRFKKACKMMSAGHAAGRVQRAVVRYLMD